VLEAVGVVFKDKEEEKGPRSAKDDENMNVPKRKRV
jgi:hypothetical protein